ncbi:hypothetical protein MAY71_26465, partial [Escherichia coli]
MPEGEWGIFLIFRGTFRIVIGIRDFLVRFRKVGVCVRWRCREHLQVCVCGGIREYVRDVKVAGVVVVMLTHRIRPLF